MTLLHDMHCHLDFMENGEEIAERAHEDGTLVFANTVTPEGWEASCTRFASFENVVTGLGLHPWWVNGRDDSRRALEMLGQHDPRVIGEIGLDLGRRHADTADAQRTAFEDILRWSASRGRKLISIHSVHAAKEALDLLESTGAAESCTCIFHWFTGPSDQLKRAVQDGCYFSFGPRALGTGKGREYVKAIPTTRLLLETDYPPNQGDTCAYDLYKSELQSAADSITAIKGPDSLPQIAAPSSSRKTADQAFFSF